MPSRVLIVEDNAIEQSALTAALQADGYIVDAVSDGLSAVRKLRSGRYDLALVDYHIPEVDGFASAKLLHELMDESALPRLVAVTVSAKELEARQGKEGIFDVIVPKPYKLDEILALVAREIRSAPSAARAAAADHMWNSVGLARRPRALVVPSEAGKEPFYQTLFDVRQTDAPEVIVATSETAWGDVTNLRENADYFHCPVIDITGRLSAFADATLTDFGRESLLAVATVIRQFANRYSQLAPKFHAPGNLSERILAYLFLSGKELVPLRSPDTKLVVRYVGFFSAPSAGEAADAMVSRGLLSKTFFDRVRFCSQCGSARLNAREECRACRSANLHQERLIHHFRCAYQAPESEFLTGKRLVCPKCSRELRHYGSDYDKPGEVFRCQDCGDVDSSPAVGFVCFDCGAHADGDAVGWRDIFGYALTDEAVRLLTTQAPATVISRETALLNGLVPATVHEEVERALLTKPQEKPIKMLELSYPAAPQIVAKVGENGFKELRSIMMNNLLAELPEKTESFVAGDRDFLLGEDLSNDDLPAELIDRCQYALNERLQPLVRQIDVSAYNQKSNDRPALRN